MTDAAWCRQRVRELNDVPVCQDGAWVLYWMQQSQRPDDNHALEYAIEQANRLDQTVLVGFGLADDYPEANLRHYRFMLEGLADTAQQLARRGLKLVVRKGPPARVALELGAKASLIVCDRGYLRHQRAWRREVARHARCRVVEIESDTVVPVEMASDKQEFAARTIRPKLQRQAADFLQPVPVTEPLNSSLSLPLDGLGLENLDTVCRQLNVDRSVAPVSALYKGGPSEARRVFAMFLRDHFAMYARNRNQPQTDAVSHMSKYLHFGQVSPIRLALEARDAGSGGNLEAFMEELLVRRELCINFVYYNTEYDRYTSLPDWARRTLAKHRADQRAPRYTRDALDACQTEDPYWNAAMREMKQTGYMHNYMRMYWGKKILEWVASPEDAFAIALALNNRYFLDGRDPNSFAGVAWVFGLHDRPWKERPVFGTTRYMSAGGLERKARPTEYVVKVDRLVGILPD